MSTVITLLTHTPSVNGQKYGLQEVILMGYVLEIHFFLKVLQKSEKNQKEYYVSLERH